MEPTDLDNIANLAGSALGDIGPVLLTVGTAGIGLVALFVGYRIVTRIVASKGKNAG